MGPESIPGERVAWYPTIEVDACLGIRDCLEICEKNIFRWDAKASHPVVERPENCELGCTACMEACPAHAITLPALEQLGEAMQAPPTDMETGRVASQRRRFPGLGWIFHR